MLSKTWIWLLLLFRNGAHPLDSAIFWTIALSKPVVTSPSLSNRMQSLCPDFFQAAVAPWGLSVELGPHGPRGAENYGLAGWPAWCSSELWH